MPRPRPNGNVNITGKLLYGFPLWGKLSPQVTDEGVPAGHFPLIRRVSRHLPPKGEGFSGGVGRPALQRIQNTAPNRKVRGGIFISCST